MVTPWENTAMAQHDESAPGTAVNPPAKPDEGPKPRPMKTKRIKLRLLQRRLDGGQGPRAIKRSQPSLPTLPWPKES
jgi:hypothetical protein